MIIVYIYMYFLTFVFGAVIGSFLNVLVYRLPRGNFLENSRSYCPNCKTMIKARDLVPIFSFLILGGKCRSCGEKISPQYPLVELFGGVSAICCALYFGFELKAVLAFGVLAILITVALIDIDIMEIPNELVIALIPFALWSLFLFEDITLPQRLIGFFIVSAPMLLMAVIINSSFGGGDIKLIAVCGFLLGMKNVVLAFFISLLLGGGYAIYLIVTKKQEKGTHIAFGPYLCIGIATALFFGEAIINWYLSFF